MNDVAWCRAALDRLDDRLRGFAEWVRRFNRDLDEALTVWTDTAARDVFARYLNPHRQSVQATLTVLRQQLDLLRAVVERMASAEAPATRIQLLADEAARLRLRAESEARSAHRHADAALEEAATARARADEVQEVLGGIA
jgi:hypothetical protein